MDKEDLIKLLNEYNKEKGWHPGLLYEGFGVRRGERNILEKSFGFLKWLVNNDKIDFKKLYNGDYYIGKVFFGEDRVDCKGTYNDEDALLMLLAISENPIDLLCGMIKN